jgi:PIN domain nuclease of toxin-antitoxin system
MRYLLDTHVFLWATGQSHKLPANIRTVIDDEANGVFVSAIVFWEIAIKTRLGKLDIGGRSALELLGLAQTMGFQLIGVEPDEAATFDQLEENTHLDLFDRMLIWQAISRKLTLISSDSKFWHFTPDGLKLLCK